MNELRATGTASAPAAAPAPAVGSRGATAPAALPAAGSPGRRRRKGLPGVAVVGLVAALALAGCSGTDSSTGTASAPSAAAGGAGGAAAREDTGAGSADRARGGAGSDGATGAGAAAPAVRQRLVRTAVVVLEVQDLAGAAARVRAVAVALGGSVASESTSFAATGDVPASDGAGPQEPAGSGTAATTRARPGQSVLVLRVPERDLDGALAQLSGPTGVGRELGRSGTAQDVTADLADLGSRVQTQRASVTRVRQLLDRAGSLKDVVLLEQELARREGDLEALQARQAALADRADLATLTVDLRAPDADVAAAEPRTGFLGGLDDGRRAVVASTEVVLTVLGAVLPVAVVALVLAGPVLWLRRRRRPAVTPPPSPVAPSAPGGARDTAPVP